MWKPLHPLYDLYRRFFGRYRLEDPRPIKAEAPYTFYLPSPALSDAVDVGDEVKLIFRSQPAGLKWYSERMWVEVTSASGENLIGKLDNTPSDMPQLKPGDVIHFQRFHIIDVQSDREPPKESLAQRQYWDRCMVDRCVVDDNVPVYYIYREEPDLDKDGDKYPDSGWRIRGDYRDISDEELDARKAAYIALGKVLNADDSWLHLIDSPIGSAFLRNFETGEYEVYDRDPDPDGDTVPQAVS